MQSHKGAFLAKYSFSQLNFFRGSSNLLDSCYEDEAEVFFPFQPLPGKVVFLSKIERNSFNAIMAPINPNYA